MAAGFRDVRELVEAQCGVMLRLGGLARSVSAGRAAAAAALAAGLGARRLVEMVERQARRARLVVLRLVVPGGRAAPDAATVAPLLRTGRAAEAPSEASLPRDQGGNGSIRAAAPSAAAGDARARAR